MILVALTVPLALQCIRALFPLLFNYGEDADFILAGVLAVAVFASPVLAAPLALLVGRRAAVPVGLAALIAARLAVQLVHPIPLWLGIVATVAALVAVTLELMALRRAHNGGGRTFVLGVVLGMAVDTAVRAVFLTWDLPWQEGFDAVAATSILAAGAVVAFRPWIGMAGEEDLEVPPEGGRWLVAYAGIPSTALVGPFLMLEVLFLQSPAFAASQAELSLEGAVTLLLVADALTLLMIPWLTGRVASPAIGLASGAALAVIAWSFTHVQGFAVAPLIVLGQILAVGLLVMALDRTTTDRPPSAWRTATGVALGGVTFMLLAVLYQIHYEEPLPFSNQWLPAVAGLLLGLAGTGRLVPAPYDDAPVVVRLTAQDDIAGGAGRWPGYGMAALAAVPVALLLVPLIVFLARPDRPVVAADLDRFRLVNYNVHLAVNPDGQLDPVATARTIENLRPDVLVLQEAGRGWPINGTMDLAEWLSRRLRMPFVYQPAADGQFGNAVFTRLPLLSSDGGFLPVAGGTQRRSYLRVRIDLGGGRSVTVIDVHLQHQDDKTATRESQIGRLIEVWGGAERTVIAGDMNTQPDEDNLKLFLDAGLLSVQDEAGLGDLPTATQPTVRGDRVDYVFVTPRPRLPGGRCSVQRRLGSPAGGGHYPDALKRDRCRPPLSRETRQA